MNIQYIQYNIYLIHINTPYKYIPIQEICELYKKLYKEGHEQDCKKINDNRLEDRTKPDINIVVNGVQIYLDIGITWDLDKYRDKKDQNGNPLKIIPIIIGKNLTIHQKSREFLEELRVNFDTIYEEIGYMISTSQTHQAELMYKKKVVQRGEKHSEIDVEKPSANRFASLADSDVQFKRTDNYGKIFDYLHEKGNNEQKETEKREPVSKNQVSESGETGPLTTL
ncbi:Hypothetical_protein [Hexamita inflata]|uniref:Hypothetical_protein n=1 Tax=Hexamita inflata TaxID=28002 RepID=A0ABP1GZ89_9EUKA